MIKSKLLITVCFAGVAGVLTPIAVGNHSWSKYHWDLPATDTSVGPLDIADTTSNDWTLSLGLASGNWNSSVIKNQLVDGGINLNCNPTAGRVEVCNDAYGENGWLGIASIWVIRGKENHITQGVVKLNDTYFSQAPYNSADWRDFVMCQEVGHTFGLGHQDENFYNANLGSCMDYTNDPARDDGAGNNLGPDSHDYDQLQSIYAHLLPSTSDSGDSGGTSNGNKGGGGRNPKGSIEPGRDLAPHHPDEWGQAVRQDAQGRGSLYYRELADGRILITHVLWAME